MPIHVNGSLWRTMRAFGRQSRTGARESVAKRGGLYAKQSDLYAKQGGSVRQCQWLPMADGERQLAQMEDKRAMLSVGCAPSKRGEPPPIGGRALAGAAGS